MGNLTSITGQNLALKYESGVSDLVPRSRLFSADLFCSEEHFTNNFIGTYLKKQWVKSKYDFKHFQKGVWHDQLS